MSVEDVLRRVALVADCSVASLRTPEMGSGANPARRLAVWALSCTRRYAHREIASALGMSAGQVANVLWRLRREPPGEPLKNWMVSLHREV